MKLRDKGDAREAAGAGRSSDAALSDDADADDSPRFTCPAIWLTRGLKRLRQWQVG